MDTLLFCIVCGESFRSFPPCGNSCCLLCHAEYCGGAEHGHRLNAERARAEYRARMVAQLRGTVADGPD